MAASYDLDNTIEMENEIILNSDDEGEWDFSKRKGKGKMKDHQN
jgi:hypothetical protein